MCFSQQNARTRETMIDDDLSRQADDILLRSDAVKKRYGGASDMWLVRRLADNSGFPKPIVIGRYRLWRLSELVAWELDVAEAQRQSA